LVCTCDLSDGKKGSCEEDKKKRGELMRVSLMVEEVGGRLTLRGRSILKIVECQPSKSVLMLYNKKE